MKSIKSFRGATKNMKRGDSFLGTSFYASKTIFNNITLCSDFYHVMFSSLFGGVGISSQMKAVSEVERSCGFNVEM
jgi:hypothetical protein